MKKILLLTLVALMGISSFSFAQEYTSNNWASWASITTQVSWTYPYRSRTISIFNGSAIPICAALNPAITITSACTSVITNQASTGDNKVFQIPATQWFTVQDVSSTGISLKSSTGAAASPVSVLVNY